MQTHILPKGVTCSLWILVQRDLAVWEGMSLRMLVVSDSYGMAVCMGLCWDWKSCYLTELFSQDSMD